MTHLQGRVPSAESPLGVALVYINMLVAGEPPEMFLPAIAGEDVPSLAVFLVPSFLIK